MERFNSDSERPTGQIDPPTERLAEIYSATKDGDHEEALNAVEAYEPDSNYQADWCRYLEGLAYYGLEYFESGYKAFQKPYERTTDLVVPEELSMRMRLAAKCLKKMGWLHRRNEDFQRGYGLHSIQYRYLLHHGSYREIHDAAISLDVDAYFLKNAYLSKMWLETSIGVAESIPEDVTRYRCLGMSWNNLAGTLCQLTEFEAAERAIESSLENWSQYENEAGTDEHRTVWAHYGVGDIYHRWGEYLADDDEEEAREKFETAEDVLNEALELAKDQQMEIGDREPLHSKLHRVQSALSEE